MVQVENEPGGIAIEYDGKSITYKGLYEESLAVYEHLKRHAESDEFIAIKAEQHILSYAIIIGVWMAGKAYVPLNAHYPQEVIKELLSSLDISTVLSSESFAQFEKRNSFARKYDFVEGELAYVIHTSGSTGSPKVALLTHHNLNAFTNHYLNASLYDFKADDRFLQSYDLSFDVSVFCFAIPLMIGATLVLPKDKGLKYLTIISAILKERITVCSNVPSVAKYAMPRIDEISMESLRYCFFSGESLLGPWALAWMKSAKNAQVYNCYGPTETTIVCTTEHLNSLDASYFMGGEALPLGLAFENMDLLLRNDEIMFKGEQVFKAYWNSAKPQVILNGDQYFPTGDKAQFDSHGKLMFKGRIDEQVQLNGYRIELSAIDSIIQKEFSRVAKSLLITIKNDDRKIVTTVEGVMIPTKKIKDLLKAFLPSYGMPSIILNMETLPSNSNGKLNVKALEKRCKNILIGKEN